MKRALKALGLAGLIALAGSTARADSVNDSINKYLTKTSQYSVKPSTSSYDIQKSTSNYSVNKSTPVVQAPVKKWGVDVGVFNEQYSKNPIADWSKKIDNDFKNGNYTSTSVIPDWKGIEVPEKIQMNGLEASVNRKIGKKFSIGLNAGYKESKGNQTNYQGTHVIDTVTTDITRQENFDIVSQSVGLNAKYNLSKKLSALLNGNIESTNLNGTMKTTVHRQDNDYTKWYDAKFSGKNNLNSLEAGIEYSPSKRISIKLLGGVKSGKIESTGKADITFSTTNFTAERDYNPIINTENSYVKGSVNLKF